MAHLGSAAILFERYTVVGPHSGLLDDVLCIFAAQETAKLREVKV